MDGAIGAFVCSFLEEDRAMGNCAFVKSSGKGDLHAETGGVVGVDAHHSRGARARGAGSLSLGGSGASPIKFTRIRERIDE